MRKILYSVVMLALATPLFASDPFVGTWKLDSAKTKYTTGTPPRELTAVIEEQGANLVVTATGTSADGSPLSVKYTVPVAGGAGKSHYLTIFLDYDNRMTPIEPWPDIFRCP